MVKYRFKLFSSEVADGAGNMGSMAEYEKLMTDSLNGDEITIMQKETKLTEMGQYLIALHWVETGTSKADSSTLKQLMDEGL